MTNLGLFGIDAFTPIINPPEAAILGLGAIRREPVFDDQNRVVPRDTMTLNLTFDHRVVDGCRPRASLKRYLARSKTQPSGSSASGGATVRRTSAFSGVARAQKGATELRAFTLSAPRASA